MGFRESFKRIETLCSLRAAIIAQYATIYRIIPNGVIGFPSINVVKFYLACGLIVLIPREVYLS